jgi:hypothetical protein
MGPCSNHARQQDEEEERMKVILQNGNTGEHYKCDTCGLSIVEVLSKETLCTNKNCEHYGTTSST